MTIDFTPEFTQPTHLRPFYMWCQKVLPLVYDDSLSYYEVLCKVTDYLNKTMDEVNALGGDVSGLYESYRQLQLWVNTYFDNLDVQEEINNKLDKMIEDGTLGSYFSSILGFVKPSFYGAKGDGITDDTNAFQMALNSNYPIYLDKDFVYLISNTLKAKSNLTIIGNNSTIKIKNSSSIENGILNFNNLSNIFIENVIFESNVKGQNGYTLEESQLFYNVPLFFKSTHNITIKKCCFNGVYSSCIKIYGCGGNINIISNEFYGVQPSFNYGNIFLHLLSNDKGDIIIENNIFSTDVSNYDNGIGAIFLGSQQLNTHINNNRFINCGRCSNTSPISPIDMYFNVDNVSISNNNLLNCAMFVRISSSSNIKVFKNTFIETIDVNPGTNLIPVYNNDLYSYKRNCENLIFDGNYIYSLSTSARVIGIGSQISNITPNNIIISNNIVFSPQGFIFLSEGTYNVIISNNNFKSQTGAFLILNNILQSYSNGSIIVQGNIIDANIVIDSGENSISGFKPLKCNDNNIISVGGFKLSIPASISNNVLTSRSPADVITLSYTRNGNDYVFFEYNKMSAKYMAVRDIDGVIVNGNYYNGVLVNNSNA